MLCYEREKKKEGVKKEVAQECNFFTDRKVLYEIFLCMALIIKGKAQHSKNHQEFVSVVIYNVTLKHLLLLQNSDFIRSEQLGKINLSPADGGLDLLD